MKKLSTRDQNRFMQAARCLMYFIVGHQQLVKHITYSNINTIYTLKNGKQFKLEYKRPDLCKNDKQNIKDTTNDKFIITILSLAQAL